MTDSLEFRRPIRRDVDPTLAPLTREVLIAAGMHDETSSRLFAPRPLAEMSAPQAAIWQEVIDAVEASKPVSEEGEA